MTVPGEYQVHTSCSTGCKLDPVTHCVVLGYDKCSKLVIAVGERTQAVKDMYGDYSKLHELHDAIEASNEGAVNAQSTNLSRQQAARLQQGKVELNE